MSAVAEIVRRDWRLWLRQMAGIVAIELRRNAFSRRALFVYLLAAAPLLLMSLQLLLPVPRKVVEGIGGDNVLYAIFYRTFLLRLVVYFGCVGVFSRLFRGDMLERTLHYYLLCPVRREVLAAGKYLAGVAGNSLIFGLATALSFFLAHAARGWSPALDFVLAGAGLGHLLAYLGVTVLACIGYGAVFMLVGLFSRNPLIPAAVLLGWEYINFLLPPLLKKFSVIYYLESLCPVPVPLGPITILAEPAPLWMAVPGIMLVTALILVVCSLRVRRLEISYTEE
jgi:ABC-type transport system involved in multi-copper enzyme maturation permease subunit